jgi:hypothetical protein
MNQKIIVEQSNSNKHTYAMYKLYFYIYLNYINEYVYIVYHKTDTLRAVICKPVTYHQIQVMGGKGIVKCDTFRHSL